MRMAARIPTKTRAGIKSNPVAHRQKIARAKRVGQKVGKVRAQQMFVKWLEKRDPFLYKTARRVAVMRKQNLQGMGAIDWGNLFQSTVDTIKTALPTYLQTKQQKEIMEVQMDRARQGLPPLDTTQYTAPIQIAPVLTPDTEAAMNRVALQTVSGGINKLILPGIALVLFLIMRKKK